jgi:hypothetical protein
VSAAPRSVDEGSGTQAQATINAKAQGGAPTEHF